MLHTQNRDSFDIESAEETYSFDEEAAKRGLSPEEYAEKLRDVRWLVADTRECLSPEEVEEYCAAKNLPQARLEHMFSCRGCRAMISVSLPTEEDFEEFLEEVCRLTQGVSSGA